jgi:hypothetical protein
VVLAAPGGQTVRWVTNTENLRGSVFCTGTDLTQGQYLVPWSTSYTDVSSFPAAVEGQSQLIMQSDCNLVLYEYLPGNTEGYQPKGVFADWASNTDNGGTGDYQGCYATMQSDGNLVIYAPNYPGGQKALWASHTVQTTAPPFNLGALGPYLALPIVVSNSSAANSDVYYSQNAGLYVTTIHGATLGNPAPPASNTVLPILSDVIDGLSLVFTFIGGPLGAEGSVLSSYSGGITGASLANSAAGVAVSAGQGAESHAVGAPVGTSCGASSASQTAVGLTSGACLVSPNHQYELRMQTDGNLVLYYQAQNDALWATFPSGPPAGVAGDTLVLYTSGSQPGNLCVEGWCNGVSATNALLVLQNDGNLVEYANNGPASLAAVPYAAWASGTANLRGNGLASGTALRPGQYLASANGQYRLSMGTGGLLELSYLTQTNSYFCPMWSRPYATTNLAGLSLGHPEIYSQALAPGSYLAMQTDGNLVLHSGTNPGATVDVSSSESNLGNNPGAYLQLGNDGNLVVYSADGHTALWQSGTELDRGSTLCTGGTLSDGQYLTMVGQPDQTSNYILVMQSDCNLVYEGSTTTYGEPWSPQVGQGTGAATTPGNAAYGCYVTMQSDGNLVIYEPNYPGGQKALWASHTVQSTTTPNVVENLGPYSLVNDGAGNEGYGAEIVTDSAKILWQTDPPKGAFAAADGNTAVSAVQVLVGFLTFLIG